MSEIEWWDDCRETKTEHTVQDHEDQSLRSHLLQLLRLVLHGFGCFSGHFIVQTELPGAQEPNNQYSLHPTDTNLVVEEQKHRARLRDSQRKLLLRHLFCNRESNQQAGDQSSSGETYGDCPPDGVGDLLRNYYIPA